MTKFVVWLFFSWVSSGNVEQLLNKLNKDGLGVAKQTISEMNSLALARGTRNLILNVELLNRECVDVIP